MLRLLSLVRGSGCPLRINIGVALTERSFDPDLDSSDRIAPVEVAALHVQGRLVVLHAGIDAADEPVYLQRLAGLAGGSLQGAAVGAASGAVVPGVVGVLDSLLQEGQKKTSEKEA